MAFSLAALRSRLQQHQPRRLPVDGAHHAAVLVPLSGDHESLRLLCFRRTDHVLHPGEICFPGGSLEAHDDGPVAAALREAREELGLVPSGVEVLGMLDDVETVVSNYVITPVVGYCADASGVRPDALEVAEVISVPVSRLTQAGVESAQWLEYRGVGKLRYSYEFDGHRIWGATGRILRSLIDLWREELSTA
ncbi:MAG TPA: CoA pyrophosphatase [Candidatus Eremiobacteraceae bacterium]|nr:CoA pyrophosphatase [Candidatus Eremiobacteraceae bacterium]